MCSAIDAENMIILHLSALIPRLTETYYEDADPASLQIMSQSYGPIDLEREGDYLNL